MILVKDLYASVKIQEEKKKAFERYVYRCFVVYNHNLAQQREIDHFAYQICHRLYDNSYSSHTHIIGKTEKFNMGRSRMGDMICKFDCWLFLIIW